MTRSGPEEVLPRESFSINSLSSSSEIFQPPRLFGTVFVQKGTDAKSGQWAAGKAESGEVPEEVYLLCSDCGRCVLSWSFLLMLSFSQLVRGSVVLGTLPPSQKDSFKIRHLPLGVGCPMYLHANRGILLPKALTTEQDLDSLLQGLKVVFASLAACDHAELQLLTNGNPHRMGPLSSRSAIRVSTTLSLLGTGL